MNTTSAPVGAGVDTQDVSLARAWYVVGILMVIYTSSFIDRSIIALMIEPIRRDLNISDTEISLLQGLAFAVFYVLAGLPLGWAADRYSRRMMIVIGTTLWSIATALCGLANSFASLFLGRVGVGVGEASLTPASASLIADLFPKEKLASALSVYNLGITIGQGMAFLIGGTIIRLVTTAHSITVPLVGELRPWQVTFIAVGLPGVLLALFMLTVREPARRGRVRAVNGEMQAQASIPLRVAMRFMWQHRRAYGFWIAGNSLLGFVLFGYGAWMPTALVRTFGWQPGQVGQWYGTMLLALGTSGSLFAAWLTDQLVRRGVRHAHYKMLAWNCVLMLPFAVAAPLVNNPALALALLAGTVLFSNPWVNISGAALLSGTPNQMRGQIVAIKFFFGSTVSFTIAPTAIALLTEHVYGGGVGVRYSIATISVIAIPAALLCYRIAMHPYEKLTAMQKEWTD